MTYHKYCHSVLVYTRVALEEITFDELENITGYLSGLFYGVFVEYGGDDMLLSGADLPHSGNPEHENLYGRFGDNIWIGQYVLIYTGKTDNQGYRIYRVYNHGHRIVNR